MKSYEIKKDIYWVGTLDPNLRIFDIIMYTPYGTTYNSYVVKGSEKTAIFETVKEEFFEEYMSKLQYLNIDITEVDYIVLHHTEPDHAGSVAMLLDICKNAKIVGSATAIKFVKEIVNRSFEYIVVNDGDTLSLGNKSLKFISAPLLHWPDTMYTYIQEDEVLITCDSFGSHYSTDKIFDDLVANKENYNTALKYYFDTIMSPFKVHVLKAIAKIENLKIDMILTGHGPVLRSNVWEVINLYRKWSTVTPSLDNIKNVTIAYVTAYGYTEILANKISEGITSVYNAKITLYNVINYDMLQIINSISESEGVLFGSPTIVGDVVEPIRNLLTRLNPIVHGGKTAGAFGSYGWSGEAVPNIENRLRELRMKIAVPGLRINFKPSGEDLEKAFNFGREFGKKLSGKGTML